MTSPEGMRSRGLQVQSMGMQLQQQVVQLTGNSLEAAASRIFDEADVNDDGVVDAKEAYELVLKLYCWINRRAPLQPPTKDVMEQLFLQADVDSNGKLSREEFTGFCRELSGRAAVRIVGFNAIRFGVAPIIAAKLAADWLLPGVDPALEQTALTIIFIAFLGNIALATVDALENIWAPPDALSGGDAEHSS